MNYNWGLIEKRLFCQRFGSMSSSELKKMIFAVYLESLPVELRDDDYSIGRALGLTDRQVKNYRIGANLLLDSDERTLDIARACLQAALAAGTPEYQASKNRISIQIANPVALGYLGSLLERQGVYREVDTSNGHLTIPAGSFLDVLQVIYPGYDKGEVQRRFEELVPDFPREAEGETFAERLDGWLPRAANAVGIVADLCTCASAFTRMVGM